MCYCLNPRPFFSPQFLSNELFLMQFQAGQDTPFLLLKSYQMTANLENYKTCIIINVDRADHFQFTWLLLSARNCSLDRDWLECLPWRSHDLE